MRASLASAAMASNVDRRKSPWRGKRAGLSSALAADASLRSRRPQRLLENLQREIIMARAKREPDLTLL
jgi:hypothetical protein